MDAPLAAHAIPEGNCRCPFIYWRNRFRQPLADESCFAENI